MKLVCIGISHHTAPLIVREKLWFSKDEIKKVLKTLKEKGINECVLFSTCNRTELYCVDKNNDINIEELKKIIINKKFVKDFVEPSDLFSIRDGDAARHLFKVASGIDSMVIGDVQILAQIKNGFNIAKESGTIHALLNRLFQMALRVGKRARSETSITQGAVSLSYAAVELAESILGGLENKTALVVGAGKISELSAKYLHSKKLKNIFIANRTEEKAKILANKIKAKIIDYDKLLSIIDYVDIIISAVECEKYILSAEDINKYKLKTNDLLIIDLGVPRNINPDIATLKNIKLLNLDDLNNFINQNIDKRKLELPKIEKIITETLSELTAWKESLNVNPTITMLLSYMENIRLEEVNKNIHRFEEKDKELIDLVTKRIVNKIIHAPVSYLRNNTDDLEEKNQIIKYLEKIFNLKQ